MKKTRICTLALFLVLCLAGACVSAFAENEKNQNIFHDHDNNSGKIALTFDDGPHPKYTEEILDILEKYNVKATFFVVGENAEKHPDLIAQIARQGHEIGNHTYSHGQISRESQDILSNEIQKCESAIYDITGEKTVLFRPPEGKVDEKVKTLAEEMGYNIILWSVDTRDWAHTPSSDIYKNVMKNVRNGSIILMHDFIGGVSPTPCVLSKILPALIEQGYEFVTVSELLTSQ